MQKGRRQPKGKPALFYYDKYILFSDDADRKNPPSTLR